MGGFIGESLESVLNQTYTNTEIFVVDDGSTDATADVLAKFGDRIIVIQQANSGPSVARNRAILHAKGKYIAFQDADDVWAETKLAKQVEHLEQHSDEILVYTDFCKFWGLMSRSESQFENYDKKANGWIFDNLLQQNFVATSSVLVRRDSLAQAGLFDTSLRGMEDLDLWLRLAQIGKFYGIDEILHFVRRHDNNTTDTLEFLRHSLRANHILLARWGHDPNARRLIRSHIGQCNYDLAYAEWCQGNISESRRAYCNSAIFGCNPASSLIRSAIASLPGRLTVQIRSLRLATPVRLAPAIEPSPSFTESHAIHDRERLDHPGLTATAPEQD
jgi:glycosyltransferase involved in cell wall biosynthesis